MGRSRRIKTLSYRLPGAGMNDEATARSLAEHWDGFEWVTGPVMVFWKGKGIGELQVWAVSEEEGRGVILHALEHMGADPSAGAWRSATVTNPRFGQTYTVRATLVSCRNGASGPPASVILDNFALKDHNPAAQK